MTAHGDWTYSSPAGTQTSPPLEGCHPDPRSAGLCGSGPGGSTRNALEHTGSQGGERGQS